MDLLDYSAFGERMRRLGAHRPWPLGGTFEVTGRCPLRCRHCYNREPLTAREQTEPPLTLAEQCRIVDELAAAGCVWLLFTGGEIFARPDFSELYIHARRRGLLITLFTSGVLVGEEIAALLADFRPLRVEITLCGSRAEIHDRVTGVPGSFDRCRQGIARLQARGVPLALKTTVTRDNAADLPRIQALAERELGLPHRFDAMLNGCLDVGGPALGLRLSAEQVVALDIDDTRRRRDWLDLVARCPVGAGEEPAAMTLYRCGAGIHSFAIDPWGALKLCALSRQPCYDLRRGSFEEGWQAVVRCRQRPAPAHWRCARCALRATCESCPAVADLEHGDAEVPSEFHCRVAQLRAQRLGLGVLLPGDCPDNLHDDGSQGAWSSHA
ncbi:MAG: radical SAM protein [Deltaproteobacteria bacterium]|nr:radical SAM protein [Deltaproteobacteria bacterium]